MMKRLCVTLLASLFLLACSRQGTPATPAARHETTYPMTATIVTRDPGKNTVNLDNVEVPGKMEAMKMDYEVRGAKVAELPSDGSVVEVTMHDTEGSYYVTDVKPKKK